MSKRRKINTIKLSKETRLKKMLTISIYISALLTALTIFSIKLFIGNNGNLGSPEIINEDDFKNSGTGITYYVSANGESTDGTDINNPMSLEIANSKKYKGNDKVLFKCGDIFYGQINFSISEVENSLFYIGNYGEGELPKINGAKIIKEEKAWVKLEGYEDVYVINLNNLDNFDGINTIDSNSCNIGFIEDSKGNKYYNVKKSVDLLSKEYDFCCDDTSMYIKCSGNPVEKLGELKLATRIDLIKLSNYTELDGLQIEYTGEHGIVKRSYPIKNIYIHNCVINNIGGSVQNKDNLTRLGNGIEFWLGASNIQIEENIIRNCYDAAFTIQGDSGGWENIIVRNNILIQNCYSFELWGSGTSTGMKNVVIYNNLCINEGRGWGQKARPNPYNSAEYVFYSFSTNANMDINIYNNKYYNTTRMYYVLYTIKDRFKANIKADNNKMYWNADTILVNDYATLSSKGFSYLYDEYNVEKSSTLKTLSNEELENTNNDYILNSNDYNEIKTYFNFLEETEYKGKFELNTVSGYKYIKDEKEVVLVYNQKGEETAIPYTNFIARDLYGNNIENTEGTLKITEEPILIYDLDETYLYNNISKDIMNCCNEFLMKYDTKLSTSTNMTKVKSQVENIKQEAQKLPSYTMTIKNTDITALIEDTYKQGEVIISDFKAKEINCNYEELCNMLMDIKQIINSLQKLLDTSVGDTNKIDKTTDINTNIEKFEDIYQYYNDDEIADISQFETIAKQSYQEITQETSKENNFKILTSYYLTTWAEMLIDMYTQDYISNAKVEIAYSTTEVTNQNVIATLNSNVDIKVTNNSNSREYIFTQNGEFTFEYTIKGTKFFKIATVKNIDTTPTTITGIENEKIYIDKVTPIISDDNLKTVKLYKDSSLIETYKPNDTISEDGRYSLEAEDEAGNRTNIEFDISRTPATITYSQSELTNKDVIATIESNYDIQVTNNSNSKQYTFTENGEFTFEYTIRGQAFTVNARVDYIDKTPPIVTGVQNGKTYYSKVAINIQEDNLESAIFSKNGEQIEFTNGMTLEEYAIYKLIATDKAGNEIDYLFEIAEKVHDTYKMDDSYIKNIDGNTLFTTFKEKLALKEEFEIQRGEEILQATEVIATGDILKTSAGESYTLVVKGDLDSNGLVNIVDLLKLRKYVSTSAKAETIETIAADIDLDNNLNIIDILKLRKILVN